MPGLPVGVILALTAIGFEDWRAGRADSATALRAEQTG
jgi:hypothetical protein